MKRLVFITVALWSAILSFTAPANAVFERGRIDTRNDTQYDTWVTIYNLGKTQHLDYGTMQPHETRNWENSVYAAGSYYYVRAEVKEDVDGHDRTIFDTTIEVKPNLCWFHGPNGSNPYGYALVELKQGTGKTFYWDRVEGKCI